MSDKVSKKRVSKKSKKEMRKKKPTNRTRGLRASPSHRLMQEGSILRETRISKSAVKLAISHVEHWIAEVGAKSHHILDLKRSKTVTPEVLMHCFSSEQLLCHKFIKHSIEWGSAHVFKAETKKDGELPHISKASASRAFLRDGGKARLTSKARRAIAALIEAKLRLIGKKSSSYAKVAGRKTIKSKDVKAALEMMQ
jgi:histone H3/H4